MKGILNVLYRRILYKIPLKFLLVLIAVFGLLFACSTNAGMLGGYARDSITINGTQSFTYDNTDIVCITTASNACTMNPGWNKDIPNYNVIYSSAFYCFNGSFEITCPSSTTFNFYSIYNDSEDTNQYLVSIDDYNSCVSSLATATGNLEICQSDLGQINIDYMTCQNNLQVCLGGNGTGNCSGTGDISWSALYINNIQHIGGPNIYIDIPEEFNWDYEYQNEDMYIDIEGYNVDYDKITGIIDTQNYKPSSEDFTYIVNNLIPLFIPGLVIILFIYWVFKFIKKIF